MSIVHVGDRPLIRQKLSLMRDQEDQLRVSRLLNEISMLMAYEVAAICRSRRLKSKPPICPRADSGDDAGKGLAIDADFARRFGYGGRHYEPCSHREGRPHRPLPRPGHPLEPVEYYCKLPADAQEREILLVDPMLATGGSASAAIGFLKSAAARTSSSST